MASTFMGLNIGANALSAFNTSVNTTANNIANAKTIGYTRQTTNLEATDALRINARYGSVGTGVAAISITQERDLYYDTKYWQNNSSLGRFEQKLYYLDQIEEAIKDDSVQEGFATIFSKMFNSLDTLKTNSSDESVRNQFINNAQSLCTYFNAVANSFVDIQKDCNEEIKSTVDSINATAKKIALLNKEINVLELKGGHANELRDERANLIDDLSQVVNVEIVERDIQNTYGANLGGTTYTVVINGQVLVDGNDYFTLECVARENRINQTDAEGLYSIVWSESGNDFAATTGTAGGRLKALFEVRDGNNNENLKGSFKEFVDPATRTDVVMDGLSNDQINALMLSDEGTIWVNNKYYDYSGWEANVDADGKLVDFTFHLTEAVSYDIPVGSTVTVGTGVNAMGIPYYQAQINEFLRNFTEMFNDIEKKGVTLDGEPMTSFFEAQTPTGTAYGFNEYFVGTGGVLKSDSDSYYQMTALNVAIHAESLRNSRIFSTTEDIINGSDKYNIVEELKKLQSDVTMFRGTKASGFLETLISDISVDTQKTDVFYKNYFNMEQSIGYLRTSVSGVDEDEEALNLIKFQNAYNMASKVISVMSQMYDKLINETGV